MYIGKQSQGLRQSGAVCALMALEGGAENKTSTRLRSPLSFLCGEMNGDTPDTCYPQRGNSYLA